MLTTREMQDEIIRLKKENDICILVHAYQNHDIWEIADFVGDSYGLSLKAAKTKNKNVLMCGVRFMAETVKILSPDKKVILSAPDADCPMARQADPELVEKLRAQYPEYTVAAYVNTTAELKAVCDVCVTSSSAVNIIKNTDSDKILFIPDCNLGAWVKNQLPEKDFKFIKGGCPSHLIITAEDVINARKAHPNAVVLVHPECHPDVSAMADYVGSTTEIMDYVADSGAGEFIVGTENSITEHLGFAHPDKKFYRLSKKCVCHDMRLTTLADVYNCVRFKGGEEIILSDDVIKGARRSIDNMIKLNK